MADVLLSARELKLLEFLAQCTGCDIYNYGDAIDGRKLEKHGLVDISKAQVPPKNGAKQQPYYGITINESGRNWISKSGLLQRGLAVA